MGQRYPECSAEVKVSALGNTSTDVFLAESRRYWEPRFRHGPIRDRRLHGLNASPINAWSNSIAVIVVLHQFRKAQSTLLKAEPARRMLLCKRH